MAVRDLDSRSLYSLPSVNNYEQTIKQLVDASPSWEKDGSGIRGRTITPLLSGLSSNGGMAEFVPQQFNQSNNETIQRSAQDPIADLILGGGGGGEDYPFKLTLSTEESTNEQVVVVSRGIILFEPSFYLLVPKQTFAAEVGYIYLKINSNSGASPKAELVFSNAVSLQNANNIVYYLIGNITYSNNQYSVSNEHLGVIYYKEVNLDGVFLSWDVATASWKESQQPTDKSIMYWSDLSKSWVKISPPTTEDVTYVFTYRNGNYAWAETTNCEEEINQ